MTKYLLIITILVLLYLYWKYQSKPNAPKPEEIIEYKDKQKERSPTDFNQSSGVYWDADDFDLDDLDHAIPPNEFRPVDNPLNSEEEAKPLSRKQKKQ